MKRKELLAVLKTVSAGISKSNLIDQMDCFVFKDNKVMSYNDEIAIYRKLDIGGIEGAVKAVELINILTKLRGDEVRLSIKDNEFLVETKSTKSGIVLKTDIELPFTGFSFPDEDVIPVNDEFYKALTMCAEVCSKDYTNPLLRYIYIEDDKMYATDRYRFIRHYSGIKEGRFFIPYNTVAIITEFCPTEMEEKDGWLYFRKEDGALLCCRTVLDEEFPTNEHLFEFDGVKIEIPEKIASIVENIQVFTSKDNGKAIDVKTKGGKMMLTGSGQHGWHKEIVKINTKEEIQFSIGGMILKEAGQLGDDIIVGEDRILIESQSFSFVAGLFLKDNKK